MPALPGFLFNKVNAANLFAVRTESHVLMTTEATVVVPEQGISTQAFERLHNGIFEKRRELAGVWGLKKLRWTLPGRADIRNGGASVVP